MYGEFGRLYRNFTKVEEALNPDLKILSKKEEKITKRAYKRHT